MKKQGVASLSAIVLVVCLVACGGSALRHSEVASDVKNFHPKSVGILPVDVGTYAEARGIVDEIIANSVIGRKWYGTVTAGDKMQSLMVSDMSFQQAVLDYTAKFKTLGFSDPDLSRKIGETAKIDAFLMTSVDYWFYTQEEGDDIAKVGFIFVMIDTRTGKQVWTATHHIDEKYAFSFSKPKLPDIARKLAKLMVNAMPH